MRTISVFVPLFLGLILPFEMIAAEPKVGERQFEAQLIWGTDKEKPGDPELKPVEPELVERLQKVFKWKYYYQVKREVITVPTKGAGKVTLSKKCEVEVRDLGKPMTEVKLFGEKKLVKRITQAVTQCLVMAGDDRNDTAWFVVLTPK
ncbi:MAG: hypothetical protein HY735_38660 [Verrucomicrobia bacterium]|nr:hypothetical protein [Verrucomicrobiota bacterium]